jgi:hypothetical protein
VPSQRATSSAGTEASKILSTKNRHYRIETNTRKFRINKGILNLPALAIAPHRYA